MNALGIDFGRVIMGGVHVTGEQDTVFLDGTLEDALASPAMPGMWEAVPRLVALFDGRAWIISKCGDRIRQRTLAWLDRHDFYARTGLDPGNVRFCRKRPEKAVHCARLGITHMIDDRPDVHRALEGIVPHRYLFGPQRGPSALPNPLTWSDAEEMITAAVRGSAAGRPAPATRRSR
ncbi:hypothetical protein [Actinomadura rayongensis]|uniref:Uncharacterized protein n=1 Tax=Actinomadura rayongensis TaxID=1429076 RepID=A0A6I4W2W1_9ACTN|nr:hypothetical protein [Actinomadura rayongensis]MXQ63698.1 hypothetical protein [Actinomadura rayongensis]